MKLFVRIAASALLIGAFVVADWPLINNAWALGYDTLWPCTRTQSYFIESIDPRFGLSTSSLMSDLAAATALWNDALGRELFVYKPNGAVAVRLVYDNRQNTTEKLQRLGITLGNDRATYDTLKEKYTAAYATYTSQKSDYDRSVAAFNRDEAAYEASVASWNQKGGAPHDAYAVLQAERARLKTERERLSAEREHINALVDTVNTLADSLNELGKTLNMRVATYNRIGASNGASFEEGLYEQQGSSRSITIYEYSNQTKLIRVLAHEFGHALGLEHVDDPGAIMYAYNQASGRSLSTADTQALAAYCRSK